MILLVAMNDTHEGKDVGPPTIDTPFQSNTSTITDGLDRTGIPKNKPLLTFKRNPRYPNF